VTDFPQLTLVNYADVRDQIQNGDLLLASGDYAFSKLIQRATASVWSHVAFVLRIEELDRVMVLESIEGRGVRVLPLSEYVTNFEGTGVGYRGRVVLARHSQFASAATPSALRSMSQAAVDRLSYPYSDEDIAEITLRIVAGSLGIQKDEMQRGPADICSEYVERMYGLLGIKIPYDPRGFVAPSDFGRCAEIALLWELETVQAIPT
jgi:Permuted papain-like amidase enzyme, YaeF/YiiX, C92 family